MVWRVFCLASTIPPAASRIDRLGAAAREASGAMNAHAVDSVQGLGELLAFQATAARGAAFTRAGAPVRGGAPAAAPRSRATGLLAGDGDGAGGSPSIWTGGGAGDERTARRGPAAAVTLLAMSAFVPIWEIAQVGRQLADSLGAARRLTRHSRGARPRARTARALSPTATGDGTRALGIELLDVSFTYPGRVEPALRDVSLSVPAGHHGRHRGSFGAGKSTQAALLLRFWDPDRGAVRLAGADARRYRLDDLRGSAGLVLVAGQYPLPPDAAGQISSSRGPAPPRPRSRRAVERARWESSWLRLPEGLDTCVESGGRGSRAGSASGWPSARAFLKDAPILILGRGATSHSTWSTSRRCTRPWNGWRATGPP
jgi:ATP-binding cassette subfamily C protein CydCD